MSYHKRRASVKSCSSVGKVFGRKEGNTIGILCPTLRSELTLVLGPLSVQGRHTSASQALLLLSLFCVVLCLVYLSVFLELALSFEFLRLHSW